MIISSPGRNPEPVPDGGGDVEQATRRDAGVVGRTGLRTAVGIQASDARRGEAAVRRSGLPGKRTVVVAGNRPKWRRKGPLF